MVWVEKVGLCVDEMLVNFINQCVLFGSGIQFECFWDGLLCLLYEFGLCNKVLLVCCDEL